MPVQWNCPKCDHFVMGVWTCWTCGYKRPRGVYVTTWEEKHA